MERTAALEARPVGLGFIPDKLKIIALVLLLALLAGLGLRAHMSYQSVELAVAGARANEEGNARLAEILLSQALVLSPGDTDTRRELAAAQLMLGDIQGSLDNYRIARDLGAGDGGSLLNDLALRRLSAGREGEAAALLVEALAEGPFEPDYHLNLAVVFRRQGKLVSERLEIERAVLAGPGRLRPLLRLADLELRMDRPQQAVAAAHEASRLYPGNLTAAGSLATATQAARPPGMEGAEGVER